MTKYYTKIILFIFGAFFIANIAFVNAYVQSSYYSQPYYQSYYQGTYATTFSSATTYVSEDAAITGSITKGSGTFVIDHPLDPKNKLLYHSFVESPDVKNIYDGVAELDKNGTVKVQLPDYFEALNEDFRYLTKPLGVSMPNLYIKSKVTNNSFVIAGGAPNGRISWQVTGIRKDPYILENPIINEVEKGPDELVNKGEYLFEGYKSDNTFSTQPDNSEKITLFELLKRLLKSDIRNK